MTREEIEQMPAGLEIDALVGIYVFRMTQKEINERHDAELSRFSKYMTDAWQIVKYFENATLKKGVILTSHLTEPPYYTCAFGARKSISADTPMLAICRAALLAVQGIE